MSKRWDVELRVRTDAHDVGADRMEIDLTGALTFYIGGEMTLAYAPGVWATVEYSHDEDGADE